MGALGRLLITGAGGFIGRAAVAAARARGIEVVAVARRSVAPGWAEDDGIEVLRADLSDPACVNALSGAMRGCGAVIHAAAHLGGDDAALRADTLLATSHLLDALPPEMRLVLVSSIAVYDTMALSPGDVLDEDAPLNTPAGAQDGYSRAKLAQEGLCAARGGPLWMMRPGAVYGPGRSWHALNGFWAGPLLVRIESDGALPLCHVDHLGRSLVSAAMTDPGGVRVVNVVDDDLPTRARFCADHRRLTGWPKAMLPVPYGAWLGVARALRPISGKLPGLLREPVLRARMMPLSYPNHALREALGGRDDAPFSEMLARSVEGAA